MKFSIAIAAIGATSVSAIADNSPEANGSPKKIGDQRRLPASDTGLCARCDKPKLPPVWAAALPIIVFAVIVVGSLFASF